MHSQHFLLISHQDSLARVVMPHVLRREDHLSVAADPFAAAALLRQEKPDAVLVALEEGDEEAALFCATVRHYSNAPIVLLTLHCAREQITRGYRLGADAHIDLPCEPRLFHARLDAILRRT
ncbi:response regulator [Anaerolineae bacterium CFX7]|nr:response regulator [Anaerolineae bacterium CFX7]